MDKDIYCSNWTEWEKFCQWFKEDPYIISTFRFDEDGGGSTTVYYIGEVPEKEK